MGYFAGGRSVNVTRETATNADAEGFETTLVVPGAERDVVLRAVRDAVLAGHVWLTAGPISLFAELVPESALTKGATLRPPPAPLAATDLLPETLPDAWSSNGAASETFTTPQAIANALSRKLGHVLPWKSVREAIDAAYRAGTVEIAPESGQWTGDVAAAQTVKLRMPAAAAPPSGVPSTTVGTPAAPPGVSVAEAELLPNELQDLADQIGAVFAAAIGYDLRLRVRLELGGFPPDEVVGKINQILKDSAVRLVLG